MGAEQYLLKPITRTALQKVLAELKTKIENEREQKSYQEKFQNESREYEQFSRTDFLSRCLRDVCLFRISTRKRRSFL